MKFYCSKCGWKGNTQELEKENVETCAGNDMLDVCPVCGSEAVFPDFSNLE